jgi:hypothetical protein
VARVVTFLLSVSVPDDSSLATKTPEQLVGMMHSGLSIRHLSEKWNHNLSLQERAEIAAEVQVEIHEVRP